MAKTQSASEEIKREYCVSKGDVYPHEVYVNLVVSDIRATLQSLGPPLPRECCIYRVPTDLRSVNEAAYTPQLVSIGPLHHGKETLNRMEEYKLRYLNQFLERSAESASLEVFVRIIKTWEPNIRCSYAENFDHLSSEKFVKMILVDAGFIIKYFLWGNSPDSNDLNDFSLYKIRLHGVIEMDLILLENQLPFFVLERLYDLAFPSRPNNIPSFRELVCQVFSSYNKQKKSIDHQEVKHFTDLLRFFQLPTSRTNSDIQSDQQKVKHFMNRLRSLVPHCCRRKIDDQAMDDQAMLKSYDRNDHFYSATELHEVGVKFEVSSSKCLLDIEFRNGVLKIPFLKLQDNTEHYIRNLMALEQCHYPFHTYICDYVKVMDYLINNAKDVDLLVRKKIIDHWLGDHGPVATLFNKLGTNVYECEGNDKRYVDLCKDLNVYYEVRRHRWKATLRHEYFSTPWRIASIIAAIILLVLTLTQTICAIISL